MIPSTIDQVHATQRVYYTSPADSPSWRNGVSFMSNLRIVVAILLILSLVTAAVVDLVALAAGKPNETVSNVLQEWAMQFPVFGIFVGMVLGHLFWPARR